MRPRCFFVIVSLTIVLAAVGPAVAEESAVDVTVETEGTDEETIAMTTDGTLATDEEISEMMTAGTIAIGEEPAALVTAVTEATGAWLDALDNEQQVTASFRFDGWERYRWSYFPHAGAGLTLRDMTADQQLLARKMIRAVLSTSGAEKAESIMALETILQRLESAPLNYRDPLAYAFTLYGKPGQPPWGWRVDGHHLAVNVTVASHEEISLTPFFLGSNPAKVPYGPQMGERLQTEEYFFALQLVQSLRPDQLKTALLAEKSLGNIVTGPGAADELVDMEGIAYPELTTEQQDLLIKLIEVYVGTAHTDIGEPYMAVIRWNLDEVHFAWAGGREEGAAFYYRIHGPRILIEFDNTQSNGNHIHSIWRDPLNDFGEFSLHHHYARHH